MTARRWLAAVAIAALSSVTLIPIESASAQATTDLSDAQLEKLKSELEAEVAADKRKRNTHQSQVLEQAKDVVDARGEVADLEQVLHEVQGLLSEQRSQVRAAELEVEVAQANVDAAQQRVEDLAELQHELKRRIKELIVQTYIGRDATLEGSLGLARTGDIYEAARIQTLVGAVYGDLRTVSDQLLAVEVDAAQAVWVFEAAVDRLEVKRQDVLDKQEELVSSVEVQYGLYQQVNVRYESTLFEAEALKAIDDQLAAEVKTSASRLGKVISEQNRRVQQRLEAERRARDRLEAERLQREGSAAAPTSGRVNSNELKTVRGIRVHESIFANVVNLLDAAEDDGITLRGGGYRSTANQLLLRRYHCGTSNYSLYRKPASSCRPPTARPGYSMHERGLAIDFTFNGRAITNRRSTAYRWLRNNATKYGLYNLPTEPWHWSVNGN